MGKLRYLNPLRIRDTVRDVRRATAGGGPRKLRLIRVGEPHGVLLPTADVEFEVQAADSSRQPFTVAIPVPWPYAWTYRLARALGVPLVSDIDHDKISFEVDVPHPGRS